MFEFISEDNHTIRHKPSGMIFKIILNPVDGEDYDSWNDTYQEFNFKGNYIISLMLNPEDYEPEPMPIGFQRIHAINRKAFMFYRSHVYIEKYEKPEGPWEDDRYLLQQQENGTDWVLVDKENEIVFLWEHKRYNDTQEITTLNDIPPTTDMISVLPRLMREAGDWLVNNHSNKL
jgi:hypothetical protein